MNEQNAIAQLKNGDIAGLETLVIAYQARAVQAAYVITCDRGLAEDIVQGAFIRVFERIDQFDVTRPFFPWFLKIVTNDAIKALKRNKHLVSLDRSVERSDIALTQMIASLPEPESMIEADEIHSIVWAAMQRLSLEQRAVVVLRYFAGLSEREMSGVLKIPTGTVKWRLFQARRFLREILGSLLMHGWVLFAGLH